MDARSTEPSGATRRVAPRWIVGISLGLLVAAQAWLWAHGIAGVPISADTDEVAPLWQRWAPGLVGVVVLLVVGGATLVPATDGQAARPGRTRALALVALAVVFTIALAAAGGSEVVHTGGKILLLVIVPLVLLRHCPPPRGPAGSTAGVVVVVAAWAVTWAALGWASWRELPVPVPTLLELVVVLLVGFLVNAVIEELFYRRWLQTHVEAHVGPWAAIAVSTLLWASWHTGIQGVGRPDLDLAAVLLAHAATGVFLGLLWSRYRRMWPLLVVHGALNAAPLLVAVASG